MARVVLILGEAGAGKSSSIATLNPKETFIINSLGKELPFRGSAKMYTLYNKETNPTGNLVNTSHGASVMNWLTHIDKNIPHIKSVVIDDNTHQSSMEYMRRIKEQGWDKFNDIAYNMTMIPDLAKKLRDDLFIFILHHVTVEGDGILTPKKIKAQTLGKLIDQKLSSYESFFTVILLADKAKTEDGDVEHFFLTRDADSTVKTPRGMFEERKIPNDLALVRHTIEGYYNGETEEK